MARQLHDESDTPTFCPLTLKQPAELVVLVALTARPGPWVGEQRYSWHCYLVVFGGAVGYCPKPRRRPGNGIWQKASLGLKTPSAMSKWRFQL